MSSIVNKAGINLNSYQGLKLTSFTLPEAYNPAGINLNPYQGLKLSSVQYQTGVRAPEST